MTVTKQLTDLNPQETDSQQPVLLYESSDHAIYWIGIEADTVFRCNAYLIVDGVEKILVDPGGRPHFENVRSRVSKVCDPELITGMIISHQDPDIAASMGDWLTLSPSARVFTHPRMHVLLPHYGIADYVLFATENGSSYELPSGKRLQFHMAPYLHSPGSIVVYDEQSNYLFSSDIWAAIDPNWRMVVEDFEAHKLKLDFFHKDYMASNIATRGFVRSIEHLEIRGILPQHGEIIPPSMVGPAMDYLLNLRCGTDLCYPDL